MHPQQLEGVQCVNEMRMWHDICLEVSDVLQQPSMSLLGDPCLPSGGSGGGQGLRPPFPSCCRVLPSAPTLHVVQ